MLICFFKIQNYIIIFSDQTNTMKQLIIAILLVLLIDKSHMRPWVSPPPPPRLPPNLPPGLFQLFVVRSGPHQQESANGLGGNLETRPALAGVPVVDHEEPVVFFWYPMHPQVPIDAFY